MSRVYVDRPALTVAPVGGGRGSVAPGAVAALERLLDAGHELALIGSVPAVDEAFAGRVAHVRELPPDVRDGWLITGDAERCDCHHAGYRMILVGRGSGQRILPTRHCDVEVRDLGQAVLHVLLADVMPTAG